MNAGVCSCFSAAVYGAGLELAAVAFAPNVSLGNSAGYRFTAGAGKLHFAGGKAGRGSDYFLLIIGMLVAAGCQKAADSGDSQNERNEFSFHFYLLFGK